MPDIDPIKAKVIIEYDGSGLEKAKEDLASLGDVSGGMGESVSGATDNLAALDEQLGKTAGSTKGLTESVMAMQKPFEVGVDTIPLMTDALAEQRSAIEDTSKALGSAQEPLIAYNEAIGNLSETVGGGHFAENMSVFHDALVNPEPYQLVQGYLSETSQSWTDFASSIGSDNMSIMKSNREFLSDLRSSGGSVFEMYGGEQVKAVTTDLGAFAQQMDTVNAVAGETNKSLFSTSAEINKFGGLGKALYGPELPPGGVGNVASLGEIFGGATEGMMGMLDSIAMPLMAVQMIGAVVGQVGQGIYDMAAVAEGPAAHSVGTFTGTVDALGQSMQKTAASFSEGIGQGILPTLNALNYQASQGSNFWGGVGGFLGGLGSTVANLWQLGTGSNPVGGIEGLVNQGASFLGMQQPFQGPGPQVQSQRKSISEIIQIVNQQTAQTSDQVQTLLDESSNPAFLAQQDQLMAAQQIYQHAQQSYSISHPINRQQMLMDYQYQQYAAQQEANYAAQQQNAPTYLGDMMSNLFQGNFGAAGADFTGGLGSRWSQMWQSQGGAFNSIGDFFSAWGNNFMHGGEAPYSVAPKSGGGGSIFDSFSDWWNNLFGGGGGTSGIASTGGCFVAGTRVLMAGGTEQAIETLQVGEQVQAHDGEKQVTTTILAFIQPPPKRVYKLTFSSGQTLTLTASHPIATSEGWKSISPEAARQENPGLATTSLQIGDKVHAVDGIVTLTSILPLQIWRKTYNITVDNPHTFYANKILVHNKTVNAQIGQQVADQIGTIQLPHIDLSGITAGLAGAFSGISLPPLNLGGLTAGLASAFSGISLPPLPNIGGMLSGAMAGMFGGISLPAIPDIGGMLSGALSGMLGGIALPSIPDIGGMLNGAMSGMFAGIGLPSIPDIGSMLSGAMSGIFAGIGLPAVPDIGGMLSGAMSGMFGGITIPSIPNIGGMINGALSSMFSGISIPSIPMFARGVQNYTGLGIVGEAGPELVSLNGGSVYPLTQSNNSGSLSLDGGGGLGLLGGDITLHIQMVMPNGQMMAEQYIPYIAPLIRQQFGRRA